MPTPDALMAPPARPDTAYVMGMLGTLFPAPAVVRATTRVGARPERTTTDFVALPNAREPKALLPRRPRAATAAAARQVAGGAGRVAAWRATLAGAAARLGLVAALPHGFVVQVADGTRSDSIEAYLRRELDTDVVVSLRIGPVRAVQKPVLQLLSPSGRTIGYAKVGTTDFTSELVRTETAALELLGRRTWTHLVVPAVLHHGVWRGLEVLVQEPVVGSDEGRPAALEAAMVELARGLGTTSLPLSLAPWWAELRTRVEALTGPVAEVLRRAWHHVDALRGGEDLELGAWHTDWAPWNMAFAGDQVLVWDWEQFEQGVPLGLDAVHFDVQQLVVREAVDPRTAYGRVVAGAETRLAAFGVPARQSALTVALYLLESTSRYLRDGESGTRLSRLDQWLPATLADVLRSVEREAGVDGIRPEKDRG